MAIAKICPECKNEFKSYPSWEKNGYNGLVSCSKECRKKYKNRINTIKCNICGKIKRSYPYRNGFHQYCSYKCYGISQRAPVNSCKDRRTLKNELDMLLSNAPKECPYCEIKMDFENRRAKNGATIDHIQALSDGGSNMLKNKQIICFTCNIMKSDWDEDSFETKRINNFIEQMIEIYGEEKWDRMFNFLSASLEK